VVGRGKFSRPIPDSTDAELADDRIARNVAHAALAAFEIIGVGLPAHVDPDFALLEFGIRPGQKSARRRSGRYLYAC